MRDWWLWMREKHLLSLRMSATLDLQHICVLSRHWISMAIRNLTSFGCLTKLYFNFANGAAKKKIARSYNIPQQEILESWMKSINALRNCCAHHGRIWNRVMPIMPQLPMKLKQAWITNKPEVANRLYSVLCCLLYWLYAIDSRNELCAKFKDLLSQYPEVDTNAMGFPKHWQDEPLWR